MPADELKKTWSKYVFIFINMPSFFETIVLAKNDALQENFDDKDTAAIGSHATREEWISNI